MRPHRMGDVMAEKTRPPKRAEHFDRQDKSERQLRNEEPSTGLQTSKPYQAYDDGCGVEGMVRSDTEYPFIEVMPMSMVLYLDASRPPIWMDIETGMALADCLEDASLQALVMEYDS